MRYHIVAMLPLGCYAKLPYMVFVYRLPAVHKQKQCEAVLHTLKTGDSTLSKKKKLLPGGRGFSNLRERNSIIKWRDDMKDILEMLKARPTSMQPKMSNKIIE